MTGRSWRERIADPEESHRLRWWTLAVLCMSLVIIGLDSNILNVAIPTLSHPVSQGGLGASTSELQWILDGYVIVFAGLLLTNGSMSDRYGRYRFLVIGLVVFGVASTCAAFAPTPVTLVASRAVMGIGASLIMPSTLSILSNVFTDPRERRKAISIWAGVSAIGSTIGPFTGGLLIAHFWWGSIFLVNVPVVIAALVLGRRLVPNSSDPDVSGLDPFGAVLSVVTLVTLLWAIIEGPSFGWGSGTILGAFGLGVVLLGVFVWWELRTATPMLDMRFFENPRFSVASGSIALSFFVMYGTVFALTQYLQGVRGLSPAQAGAVLIPQSMLFLCAALATNVLVERLGGKIVVATGLVILAVGLLLYTLFRAGTSIPAVIAITMVLGCGIAFVMAAATDSIMGALPKERSGVGSAMNDTTRQFGGALGIAVFGSLLATRYSASLAAHLPPRLRLGDSIGETTTLAHGRLAGADVGRVVDAAHHAFLSGLRLTMVVAAVVILVTMVGVVLWLPARGHDELPMVVASEEVPAVVLAD